MFRPERSSEPAARWGSSPSSHSAERTGAWRGLRPRRFGQALAVVLGLLAAQVALGQGNGKLQLHFIDVWQGDGTLLISPQGETVMFDSGAYKHCQRPLAYLQQLGITGLDYHVASHYHADHIGCAKLVLAEFPLRKAAYDRGNTPPPTSSSFPQYEEAVGALRRTAEIGAEIVLDETAAAPVTIRFVAVNATTADGLIVATDNENDLSLVAVVEYGGFRVVIGGDLSGRTTGNYEDIETDVAPFVGKVDVYKVHHHCSRHSTNRTWLTTTQPRIGVISCGDNNGYGHPTEDCLRNLHDASVTTYWTERGDGAPPVSGRDVIAGTVIVEAGAATHDYTVSRTRDGVVDRYAFWSSQPVTGPFPGGAPSAGYAWSKLSRYYHVANCPYVRSISPQNLVRASVPPANKERHRGCPQ